MSPTVTYEWFRFHQKTSSLIRATEYIYAKRAYSRYRPFLQKYAHGGETFRDYLTSKYYVRAYILHHIMTRGRSRRKSGTTVFLPPGFLYFDYYMIQTV